MARLVLCCTGVLGDVTQQWRIEQFPAPPVDTVCAPQLATHDGMSRRPAVMASSGTFSERVPTGPERHEPRLREGRMTAAAVDALKNKRSLIRK